MVVPSTINAHGLEFLEGRITINGYAFGEGGQSVVSVLHVSKRA